MTPDLAAPIRAALIGSSSITSRLSAYKGSFPVFTRRPIPDDAAYPVVVVSPDVAVTDEDGLNDYRPVVERDVTVYGSNDTPENYRNVEAIGYAIRTLFHRQRLALSVSGWGVVGITARGPIVAPVASEVTSSGSEQVVGRMVALSISLARRAS